MKAWEAGESVASEKVVTPPPAPDTLAVVIPLADGMLWKGDSTEKTNFAHLWAIADILGRGTRLDDIDTHAVDKVIKGLAKLGKARSEEHTSELQSLMRISYAVFCLKKNTNNNNHRHTT